MRLEFPEILHAAGLADSPGGYTLTVEDAAGATHQVKLTARPPHPEANSYSRLPRTVLQASPLPDEDDQWVRSLQVESDGLLPLYLQQIQELYWWTPLQNSGGYLRLQEMVNGKDQTMSDYFDETIKPLADGSLQYLVVDLRSNPGSDITLNSPSDLFCCRRAVF